MSHCAVSASSANEPDVGPKLKSTVKVGPHVQVMRGHDCGLIIVTLAVVRRLGVIVAIEKMDAIGGQAFF